MSDIELVEIVDHPYVEVEGNQAVVDLGEAGAVAWAFKLPEGATPETTNWHDEAEASANFPQSLIARVAGSGEVSLDLSSVECGDKVQIDVSTGKATIGGDNILSRQESINAFAHSAGGAVLEAVCEVKDVRDNAFFGDQLPVTGAGALLGLVGAGVALITSGRAIISKVKR